jgi:hypothetical protein
MPHWLTRAGTACLALCWLTAPAAAQDGTISGTVTDEARAVLPAVTITATSAVSGRRFVGQTDERGAYRLVAIPPDTYKVRAERTGFASVVVPDLEVLTGQQVSLPFVLPLARLESAVIVSADIPLVDTQATHVGGNVDRRQMELLPIRGRNWLELLKFVKGITANEIGRNSPGVRASLFQLNLDGQEITQGLSTTGFGQPGLSRDAIAELQVVTNLFDVTMGRSAGLQVHAISRSGTNSTAGTAYGYFRDDSLNARDPFLHRVLPYANQQVGGTLGGPIVVNRLHYFASHEYEREPNTSVITPSALAGQSISFATAVTVNSTLGRVDYQFSARDHLALRMNYYQRNQPRDLGNHPSRGAARTIWTPFFNASWTRVLTSSAVQELKAGYYFYRSRREPMAGAALTAEYRFPGLTLGPLWNYPQDVRHRRVPIRYDLFWRLGTHQLKVGGEWLSGLDYAWWPARQRGQYSFGALPADAARRFPLDAWDDPSRWDFSGLDPIALRYDVSYARDWNFHVPRPTYAAWIGDTWRVRDRITLNYGVRYDLAWGDTAPPLIRETDWIVDNGRSIENVGLRNDIRDVNNVAPRVGLAWRPLNDERLVIRAGTGIFYGNTSSNQAIDHQHFSGQRLILASYANDGRPGFIQDPTRGVTADDVLEGRAPAAVQSPSVIAHDFVFPYAWQTIVGLARQIGATTSVDADLTYSRGRNEDSQRDPNLYYDPTTGFNLSPARAGRPNPNFGPILLKESKGRSDGLSLAIALHRRYRRSLQGGIAYTAMLFKRDTGQGEAGYGAQQMNPFDINADWARSSDFQRHTLRAHGLWSMPWRFTVSGSFAYGSGTYSTLTSGVDPLGTGVTRMRRDGTVIARNGFRSDPFQALDLRLSRDFSVAGRTRVTLIGEVFNLYNYARYSYNLIEPSALFGRRQASAGDPRTGQLAVRLTF